MDKRERLEVLINNFTDGNKKRFTEMLGVIPQRISAWLTRNTYDTELVYQECESVPSGWSLSEVYDMIKKNLQFVDVESRQLIQLCKSLVENYQQRDAVLGKLVPMYKD